jgi:hypothetical protein
MDIKNKPFKRSYKNEKIRGKIEKRAKLLRNIKI